MKAGTKPRRRRERQFCDDVTVDVQRAASIPFETIVAQALAVARDRRNHALVRREHARVVYTFVQWMHPDERLVADILTCATKALDDASTARLLTCAVWRLTGDEPPHAGDPRVAKWVAKLVERALAEGHLAAFAALLDVLCVAPGFDGAIPADWIDGVVRARECADARADVYWFLLDFVRIFAPSDPPDGPFWLVEAWSDPRLGEAVADARPDGRYRTCPLCRRPEA